jgi:hypothetical protein
VSDTDEPPEPVLTFEALPTFGPILVGCGAGVWLGIRMIDSGEWEAGIILFGIAAFWVLVIAWVIYIRYRRVRDYHRRIRARLESKTNDPARN